MLRTTLNRSKVVAKQFSAKNGLTLAPASVSAANFRQFSAQKEADPTELIKDIVHSAVTLAGEVVPWFTKNMPVNKKSIMSENCIHALINLIIHLKNSAVLLINAFFTSLFLGRCLSFREQTVFVAVLNRRPTSSK